MDLNTIWFILIAVLFSGYFFLEGFDYGVGILLPFIGKDDLSRRVIINTIGPHWDGNEVWLLTAGGASFAAFPNWYATLFSGFYIALLLMLAALIVRAVAFEYRSKEENPTWRKTWDWVIFFGSLLPAFLWGVAIANIVKGVPINQNMVYVGGFFNLLNPYALIGGLAFVALFTLHGAIFLSLKTTNSIEESSRKVAFTWWWLSLIFVVAFVVYSYFATDIFSRLGFNPGISAFVAAVALILAGIFVKSKSSGWAFIMTALTIVFTVITIFRGLYPRVMVSSLSDQWSLTIYNASASPYTLKVMAIVAVIFVPIVLIYQAWSYWIFRERISAKKELEY